MPDFSLEDEALGQGHAIVCGIDEAGRGPWAGPVVAGAVILDKGRLSATLVAELGTQMMMRGDTNARRL